MAPKRDVDAGNYRPAHDSLEQRAKSRLSSGAMTLEKQQSSDALAFHGDGIVQPNLKSSVL
jgi:hypothetical protein